jgi:hypothetical protein
MTDIVQRLRFDSARCEAQFSKGVATNIDEAIAEIERLRIALKDIQREAMTFKPPRHSWYYDRAQNALTNSAEPLVRDGLSPLPNGDHRR